MVSERSLSWTQGRYLNPNPNTNPNPKPNYHELKVDAKGINAEFAAHLKTDYLALALKPLMEQYAKGKGEIKQAAPVSNPQLVAGVEAVGGAVSGEVWYPPVPPTDAPPS